MANEIMLGLNMDKDLIETNINKAICAAITTALGDTQELVNNAVASIICTYVKKDSGEICNKSNYNAEPYLQYIAEKCVLAAVREQMNKAIEEHKDAFAEEIKKALSNPKNRKTIAGNFISTMLSASNSIWRMPVSVTFEVPKDSDY